MSELTPQERIIVALDTALASEAMALAERLAPHVGAVKVGLELVNRTGPLILRNLARLGLRVFYDAKFHDIPNTVAGAVRGAAAKGCWMLNLHASGGVAMMRAAVAAAEQTRPRRLHRLRTRFGPLPSTPALPQRPLLVAVTLLTSIDERALREELGVPCSPTEHVLRLARLAAEAGLDGVVASPQEAAPLREAFGRAFVIVTPGVRPSWSSSDDQRRIATPAEAVAAGADYLVIGRPITRAADPVSAVQRIAEELS